MKGRLRIPLLLAFWVLPAPGAFAVEAPTPSIPDGPMARRLYTELRARLATVVVNGTTITHGDVEERMKTLRREDHFAEGARHRGQRPGAYRQWVKDLLIDETVALQEAAKRGFQVDLEAVAQSGKNLLEGESKDSHLNLLESGYREETYLAGMARNVVINRLRQEISGSMPRPSTQEMRDFYEKNRTVFETTPEAVLVRRIFLVRPDKEGPDSPASLAVKKRAGEILKRIVDGEDFAQIADRTTEDFAGIGKGGNMGWVTRGIPDELLEKAVFSQEVGVAPEEPVLVDGGWAILRVDERRPATYQPFEEAIPRILEGMRIAEFKRWLADRRSDAIIEWYEDPPMMRVLNGEKPRRAYGT